MGEDTIRERLARVETELKNLRGEFKEFKGNCNHRFDEFNDSLTKITSSIQDKLRGSLTGTEKVAIVTAIITSIGAIAVALITALS